MLPDLSVFWVIFFVLLLTALLNRLLFKPVLRVMEERERAIRSARELADRSADNARLASAEFEKKTAEARAELYRQMDEMRRAAMTERADIMTRTRAEAESEIAAATAKLTAEAEEARRRLSTEADALGAAVAERILGRKAS
ncbi:MAG: ATP synthase F0 subunit B [Acidobacteriota bacterium]|nr:ATP synthase F0 subunit B [Acidobacteriota bacterium]